MILVRNKKSAREGTWKGIATIIALSLPLCQAQESSKIATSVPSAQLGTELNETIRKKLDLRIREFSFEQVSFPDVLEFLAGTTGLNIYANWKELENSGIDNTALITINGRDIPGSTALEEILAQADKKGRLHYVINNNIVQVGLRGAPVHSADLTSIRAPDKEMQALLDRTLPEVSFDGTALGDVVKFISAVTGTKIAVDWRSMEGRGIDPNTSISIMKLRDVKVSKVLSLIFESATANPVDFTYKLDNNVISVFAAPPPTTHPS